MLKLTINDLKENMLFSKPLYSEEGEIIVGAHVPLTKNDIKTCGMKGYYGFYTQGYVVNKGEKVSGYDIDELVKLKNTLINKLNQYKTLYNYQNFSEDSDKSTNKFKNIVEQFKSQLDQLKFYEKIINTFSLDTTDLIEKKISSAEYSASIQNIVYYLVREIEKDFSSYIKILSNVEIGSSLISHSLNVAVISIIIAQQLNFNHKSLIKIGIGGLLHDIGKITFEIINEKEGVKPSIEEINIALSHPVYGYKLAREELNMPIETCKIILNHHEEIDGTGYPRGINGKKLSIPDKIVFIANLFVNLIQKNEHTGYNLPLQQVTYLAKNYPNKFDTNIVKTLLVLENVK